MADDNDPQGEQLHRLFTELANDPDAPPSSVSPLSVIAAAKRAEVAQIASTEIAVRPSTSLAEVSSTAVESTSSVGERHLQAVHADADRTRRSRRRTGLLALAVAASLAGIAAVVIPITLSGGSSTTTSADAARDSATVAASGQEGAAALAAEAPAADSATGEGDAAADAAAGAAPEGAAGGADSQAAGSERPAPGPDALTESVPAEGQPPSPEATTEAASSCWPPLSEEAAAALSGALPAGTFGPPNPLVAECGPDPVAGALLVGTTPGTALEVRVSQAELGACTRGSGEAGVRCVPRGEGVYVATDGGGQPTAFAYGNGNEVAVGGWPATGDSVAVQSGLTADQLVSAAQAVLGALG